MTTPEWLKEIADLTARGLHRKDGWEDVVDRKQLLAHIKELREALDNILWTNSCIEAERHSPGSTGPQPVLSMPDDIVCEAAALLSRQEPPNLQKGE